MILSKLSVILKTYKVYAFLILGIMYSIGLWHVCSRYTTSEWQSEKTELVQKALETTNQRQELANQIGKQLEEKLNSMRMTQTTINQKVIRETVKEPVYIDCHNTPDVVQLIEDSIDNKGQSSSK